MAKLPCGEVTGNHFLSSTSILAPIPRRTYRTAYRYELEVTKGRFEGLPVTSPHGNFATVTSPQKLRHMVTSPHFEKVKGDVGIVAKCVGVWGEEVGMWKEV